MFQNGPMLRVSGVLVNNSLYSAWTIQTCWKNVKLFQMGFILILFWDAKILSILIRFCCKFGGKKVLQGREREIRLVSYHRNVKGHLFHWTLWCCSSHSQITEKWLECIPSPLHSSESFGHLSPSFYQATTMVFIYTGVNASTLWNASDVVFLTGCWSEPSSNVIKRQ